MENKAKPFLKWAGGKSQLIETIYENLPTNFNNIDTYIEPFIGGGAILFSMIEKFPHIKNFIINDINEDLTNVYKCIKLHPDVLIYNLSSLVDKYKSLNSLVEKENYYYEIRESYNCDKSNDFLSAAYFIFLNKTCFNGLYRVNRLNKFNVPFGKKLNPTIFDKENIYACSTALQNVTILTGDYRLVTSYITNKSFVYLDPPYKPVSNTSNFNAYSSSIFDDNEQIELLHVCEKISSKNALFMASNSNHSMFDTLYSQYNIKRIDAKRRINSKGNLRGNVKEILITNY